jgi:hypothetical protein
MVVCGILSGLSQLSYAAEAEKHTQPTPPPTIVKQPQDQLVKLGSNATFTVTAKPDPLSYQWVYKCEPIPGATNKTLTISNITTNDVGWYACAVHTDSDQSKDSNQSPVFVMTQPALLMGWSHDSPLTVWSMPPPGGSGGGSGCPYPYIGYINFFVPCPPPPLQCGFTLNAETPKTAKDITRIDTKIKFFGTTFGNNGCGTGVVTVSPLTSTSYKFTVFFPSGPMPTNAYPLQLNGFNPP